MGPVTCHMPHGHWLVKQFDLVKDDIITTRTHRWSSNPMIRCELGPAMMWNQTRGSRRVRGYQPRWVLTLGASPAVSPIGGACQWSVLRWTRTRIEEKRGLGVWLAHQEHLEQLGEVGEGWNRRRAWRQAPVREERERRIPLDWAHSSSIPSMRMPYSSIRSSGDSQRGSGWSLATAKGSAGARVSVTVSESFRKEERRNLRFFPGGGTPFYSHRRSAAFILGVDTAAADRAMSSQPRSCLRRTTTSFPVS
jgi:hypothetical protein